MDKELTTEDVFGPEVKDKRKSEPVEKPEPVEAKEPEKEPEPKAEAPEKPEAAEEPEQQETGEKSPPPGEGKPPQGYVPLAAIEDERKKRQEWERKAREYERQQQERQQKEQRIPPEFRQDPEGYLRHMEQNWNQQFTNAVNNLSTQLVRSVHPDYDEMENYLIERTDSDPALAYQIAAGLQQAQNPALFAYEKAKELKRLDEVNAAGGWEAWQKAQEQRIREQLQAEFTRQQSQANPDPEAPPESLAAAPSTVTKQDTFKQPSTKDIFN